MYLESILDYAVQQNHLIYLLLHLYLIPYHFFWEHSFLAYKSVIKKHLKMANPLLRNENHVSYEKMVLSQKVLMKILHLQQRQQHLPFSQLIYQSLSLPISNPFSYCYLYSSLSLYLAICFLLLF